MHHRLRSSPLMLLVLALLRMVLLRCGRNVQGLISGPAAPNAWPSHGVARIAGMSSCFERTVQSLTVSSTGHTGHRSA
jgi:hypothetical protein